MTPYAIIFFVACLGKSQSHLSLGAITIEVQIIWVAQGRNYETGPLVFDKSRNSRSSLRGICFLSSSPSDLLGLFRNNLVKLIILGFLCWHANYSLGIFFCVGLLISRLDFAKLVSRHSSPLKSPKISSRFSRKKLFRKFFKYLSCRAKTRSKLSWIVPEYSNVDLSRENSNMFVYYIVLRYMYIGRL